MKQKERLIQITKPKRRSSLYSLVALPWCCLIPVAISWVGAGSGLFAALLRPLSIPLLVTSIILLGYSHYRVWIRERRSRPQLFWLTTSSFLSITLWGWSLLVMRILI